jgi:biofilm protein TabA
MLLGDLQHTTLALPAVLERGLAYLRATDFSQMVAGKYPIDGENMFALVQDPVTQAWDTGLPEFHARYLDIQCLLEGEEAIGYAPADRSLARITDHLAERDIAFVAQQAGETRLLMRPGMYAIFFPGELHRPCRAAGLPMQIKKVVIKISAELLQS